MSYSIMINDYGYLYTFSVNNCIYVEIYTFNINEILDIKYKYVDNIWYTVYVIQ